MRDPVPPEEDRPPSDRDLMARAAGDDDLAFAELVRRHQDGLVNFFRRMGDYNDNAEDLAQETFLRLFRYRKAYRPRAKFSTFLYLLARRTWIDHCRAAGRRRRAYERLAAEAARNGEAESPASREVGARAAEALSRLSEEMRMVVVMSIYQGFKYREIAEALRLPEGTVKSRMFHALRLLREALSDEDAP
jgi:RNA polymerase sigma-70 factor (ECF subfamily)